MSVLFFYCIKCSSRPLPHHHSIKSNTFKNISIIEKNANYYYYGQELSIQFQSELTNIQKSSCDVVNFECGHQDFCGLGCQLHHRMACVIMSYALKMPVIHIIEPHGPHWPYRDGWLDVFEPFGSSCTPKENSTYKWVWNEMKKCSDGKYKDRKCFC